MSSEQEFDLDRDDAEKSKTQIKKEMHALRDLGVAISKLPPEQQAQIPLSDTLRRTIEEAPRVKGNGAIKRHQQFIGKLMRDAEIDDIRQAYENITGKSQHAAQQQHIFEAWRDRLINEEGGALEAYIEAHPNTDRQQLRQLVRGAVLERQQGKAPTNARKLFRFIRDASEG